MELNLGATLIAQKACCYRHRLFLFHMIGAKDVVNIYFDEVTARIPIIEKLAYSRNFLFL